MVFLAGKLDDRTADKLREIFEREGEISIAIRIVIALKDYGQPDLLQRLVEDLDRYEETTAARPAKKLGHSLSISRGQNLVIEDIGLLERIAAKLPSIRNEHMNRTLLLVLGRSKAGVARKAIEEVLVRSSDIRTKRYAIAALGKIGNKESLAIAQRYLKHENDVIRREAEAAIANIESQMIMDYA